MLLSRAATDVRQAATSACSVGVRSRARRHVVARERSDPLEAWFLPTFRTTPPSPGAVAPATSVTRFSQPGFAYFGGTTAGNYPRLIAMSVDSLLDRENPGHSPWPMSHVFRCSWR